MDIQDREDVLQTNDVDSRGVRRWVRVVDYKWTLRNWVSVETDVKGVGVC